MVSRERETYLLWGQEVKGQAHCYYINFIIDSGKYLKYHIFVFAKLDQLTCLWPWEWDRSVLNVVSVIQRSMSLVLQCIYIYTTSEKNSQRSILDRYGLTILYK